MGMFARPNCDRGPAGAPGRVVTGPEALVLGGNDQFVANELGGALIESAAPS